MDSRGSSVDNFYFLSGQYWRLLRSFIQIVLGQTDRQLIGQLDRQLDREVDRQLDRQVDRQSWDSLDNFYFLSGQYQQLLRSLRQIVSWIDSRQIVGQTIFCLVSIGGCSGHLDRQGVGQLIGRQIVGKKDRQADRYLDR